MTPRECPWEGRVVDALIRGEETSDLSTHVEQCAGCDEAARLVRLLREDRMDLLREARVPAAGQVWWRAAVRARLEAAHAADRPMTWLQGLTGAAAGGVAIAIIAMAWPTLREMLGVLDLFTGTLGPGAAGMVTFARAAVEGLLPVLALAGVCILLAPLALYWALSD